MMSKFPFTMTQWQELEHQALIFKYMVSGIPIPPDLLFAIRRTHHLHDSTKLLLSHHQHQHQHVGWSCFQMGSLGRKIDPEPGRCRRTDGKKWRCSKDAFPDSKYCERHMHRGKNRSRKPVEISKSPISSSSSQTLNNKSGDHLHCYGSNGSSLDQNPFFGYNNTNQQYHTASSKEGNGGSLILDSDFRYALFSEEPARTLSVEDSCRFPPLTMSLNSHESSYLQHKHHNDDDRHRHYKPLDRDHGHHLNLFGGTEDQARKTIHFFDEWPKKEKGTSSSSSSPWIDLEEKTSGSTTQLSISMPKSYEFPIFTSRNHNGD